jgi:hypothetical protein
VDDCRETVAPGGAVIRELASAMNGVFDLKVTFNGERIVAVSRAGRAVAVSADAARHITWIGRQASPGAKVDGSLADGLHDIGGQTFILFRYKGTLYAESAR